ncbi:MAG: hypothetical protein ACLQVD_01270 [Capsulimonadaceae bacterium]
MNNDDLRPFRCLPYVRITGVADDPEMAFLQGANGEVCDYNPAAGPCPISVSLYKHPGYRYAFRPEQLEIVDPDEVDDAFFDG